VRPVLNLRLDKDVKAMRAIAEEAFALVRATRVRIPASTATASCFRIPRIHVRPRRYTLRRSGPLRSQGSVQPRQDRARAEFDDPTYFRYAPGYHGEEIATKLDWSAYSGSGGGFRRGRDVQQQRRLPRAAGGVMCPSYRVTREERDVTRRANSPALPSPASSGLTRSPPTRWRRR
jgi:hypothetical protein